MSSPVLSMAEMLAYIAEDNGIPYFNIALYKLQTGYDHIEKHAIHKRRVQPGKVEQIIQKPAGIPWGIFSNVRTRLSPAHLTLLDFKCQIDDNCQADIGSWLFRNSLTPGFLVNSGNSYHYYGSNVVGESRWEAILEEAREFSYIDEAWIGSQLIARKSFLRLSPGKSKSWPVIIEALGYRHPESQGSYLFDPNFSRKLIRV